MQQNESNSKKKNPLIPLVIDRRRWLRGEGSVVSALYRSSDRKMCCLGFACLASGLLVRDIRDHRMPFSFAYSAVPLAWAGDWGLETDAANENDTRANESVIAALLEKLGFAVRFTH